MSFKSWKSDAKTWFQRRRQAEADRAAEMGQARELLNESQQIQSLVDTGAITRTTDPFWTVPLDYRRNPQPETFDQPDEVTVPLTWRGAHVFSTPTTPVTYFINGAGGVEVTGGGGGGTYWTDMTFSAPAFDGGRWVGGSWEPVKPEKPLCLDPDLRMDEGL